MDPNWGINRNTQLLLEHAGANRLYKVFLHKKIGAESPAFNRTNHPLHSFKGNI